MTKKKIYIRPVSIYLTEEHYELISNETKEQGISYNKWIREAIDQKINMSNFDKDYISWKRMFNKWIKLNKDKLTLDK